MRRLKHSERRKGTVFALLQGKGRACHGVDDTNKGNSQVVLLVGRPNEKWKKVKVM